MTAVYLVTAANPVAAANVGGRGAILIEAASAGAALTAAATVLLNDSESSLSGSAALAAFEDSGDWVAVEMTVANLESVRVTNVPSSIRATVFDGVNDSLARRGA
jgi:hypothetical protein